MQLCSSYAVCVLSACTHELCESEHADSAQHEQVLCARARRQQIEDGSGDGEPIEEEPFAARAGGLESSTREQRTSQSGERREQAGSGERNTRAQGACT